MKIEVINFSLSPGDFDFLVTMLTQVNAPWVKTNPIIQSLTSQANDPAKQPHLAAAQTPQPKASKRSRPAGP